LSKAADKSRRVRKVNFLKTHSFDDMFMNAEKNSFCRMMFDIDILERIEEVVGR